MPATLEVTTTRRTSSAAAASTAIRGDSAFTRQTRSGRVRADEAGAVEHGVAAAEGAPQRRAVEHVGPDRLDLRVAEACETRLLPVSDADGADWDASCATCAPMKPVAPVTQTVTTSARANCSCLRTLRSPP